MRTGMVGKRHKIVAPSMARDHGLRRHAARTRWHDETAYLLSQPANARWIMDSIAELDSWRASSGDEPFDPSYARDRAR